MKRGETVKGGCHSQRNWDQPFSVTPGTGSTVLDIQMWHRHQVLGIQMWHVAVTEDLSFLTQNGETEARHP